MVRLPVVSKDMLIKAQRNSLSPAFNPSIGNPVPFDKQSPQLRLVRVDRWIPAKLMVRFTFRDSLVDGVGISDVASILFNRPVGNVMQIIPPDVEVRKEKDPETGLDSYVPVDKDVIGAVLAINAVPSNKYVFLGYLMMMGETFDGEEDVYPKINILDVDEEIETKVPPIVDSRSEEKINDLVPDMISTVLINYYTKIDVDDLISGFLDQDEVDGRINSLVPGMIDNKVNNTILELASAGNWLSRYPNIATGSDYLQTTTGVAGEGATVTSSTDWAFSGNRSFKVVTDGVSNSERLRAPNSPTDGMPTSPGESRTVSAWVKGTGTVQIQLIFRNTSGGIVQVNTGSVVTLSDTPQKLSLTQTTPANTALTTMKVVTVGAEPQAVTFYVDKIFIGEE